MKLCTKFLQTNPQYYLQYDVNIATLHFQGVLSFFLIRKQFPVSIHCAVILAWKHYAPPNCIFPVVSWNTNSLWLCFFTSNDTFMWFSACSYNSHFVPPLEILGFEFRVMLLPTSVSFRHLQILRVVYTIVRHDII